MVGGPILQAFYDFLKSVAGAINPVGNMNVSVTDEDGNPVSAQYPFATNGDSIYSKDIDEDHSDINDFTGVITDLVDDLHTTQTAASVVGGGSNPKSFSMVFHRPISNTTMGLSSLDNSISNAKITLKTVSGATVKVIDFSADSTKRPVQIFQFPQEFFTEVLVEFYTDDAVTLNGFIVLKSHNVNIDAISGVVSNENSTTTPLLANASYIGEVIDTKNYGNVICSVYSDVASATDGLAIEFSSDRTNWFWTDVFTIAALTGKTYSIQTQARYMRVCYVNGITNQTTFDLTTILKPVYTKPSSHRIADPVSGQDDAELVKSILTGQDEVSGIFENIKSFNGALNVTDGLVHKKPINFYFSRDIGGSTNPSVAIASQDLTITVDDPTGFSAGDIVAINEGVVYEFLPLTIIGVTGSDITFNRPIDKNYTTAANVDEIEINMNKDGSGTPISYKITPPAGQKWQVARLILSMLDSTSMDDGLFGGLAALTNGVLLRTYINGIYTTPSLWQTNGDIANDMYDVTYTPKAPAGQFGLRGRFTITNAGAIVDLDGDNGDYIEVFIQDSLIGIDNFTIKTQGRIFGE